MLASRSGTRPSTAREHGRRYVEAIDWELTAQRRASGGLTRTCPRAAWSSSAARGTTRSPRHHRAALVVVPQFHRDARGIFDKVFWR